jgi:ferredoxin
MLRKIVKIDEAKCDGCGICATACHEKAIAVIDGKARLLQDNYCDGLGACLPVCPAGAIGFEEREAAAFDQAAASLRKPPGGEAACGHESGHIETRRRAAWPIQLKLVSPDAGFFDGADILISADCAAYRYENFYRDFIKNSGETAVTLIGCPKLDNVDYSVKLSEIAGRHSIKSITLVKMEVPCCGGLSWALANALSGASGKKINVRAVTVSVEGAILKPEES